MVMKRPQQCGQGRLVLISGSCMIGRTSANQLRAHLPQCHPPQPTNNNQPATMDCSSNWNTLADLGRSYSTTTSKQACSYVRATRFQTKVAGCSQ